MLLCFFHIGYFIVAIWTRSNLHLSRPVQSNNVRSFYRNGKHQRVEYWVIFLMFRVLPSTVYSLIRIGMKIYIRKLVNLDSLLAIFYTGTQIETAFWSCLGNVSLRNWLRCRNDKDRQERYFWIYLFDDFTLFALWNS